MHDIIEKVARVALELVPSLAIAWIPRQRRGGASQIPTPMSRKRIRSLVNVLGPPCLAAAVFGLNWVWSRLAVRSFLRRIGRDMLAEH